MGGLKIPGGLVTIFVLGIVAMSTYLAGGISTKNDNLSPSDNSTYSVNSSTQVVGGNGSNNLQLKTFLGIQITPLPLSPVSPPPQNTQPTSDTPVDSVSSPISTSTCVTTYTGVSYKFCNYNGTADMTGSVNKDCSLPNTCVTDGGDGTNCCSYAAVVHTCGGNIYCEWKPVIYLYPEKPTEVSVSVKIPGYITVSDPIYPQESGWKNILAFPSGNLIYKNKVYKELFYETVQDKSVPPKAGYVIEKQYIENALKDIALKLGLNKNEQKEFLDFWVPEILKIDKPYMRISFFTKEEKVKVDQVIINPKPDTFIEIMMYFKGEDRMIKLPTPIFPNDIKRIGFTAVEWGGIVDH